jgi:hypothetical protein
VGLIGGLMKAGIAKKIYSEARKPHNQAKAKQLFKQVTGKGGGSTGGTAPRY